MITVTISGPNPDRGRIAQIVESAMLGSRFTTQRFRVGNPPPDSAVKAQVRIIEEAEVICGDPSSVGRR